LQSIFLSKEGMFAHSLQSVNLGDNIILIFYLFGLAAHAAHTPFVN
jgi:hypothetical protein